MTAKQKAARVKFKKAIAEAKKLRAKNPKLSQAQAVKQAWAILYNIEKKKQTRKVSKKIGYKHDRQMILFKTTPLIEKYIKQGFSRIEAIKKAELEAAQKRNISGIKKPVKKISEKSILNKIHKVKHDVEKLDEAQHSHMIGNIKKGSRYTYFHGYSIEKKPIEMLHGKRKKKIYVYKSTFGVFHTLKEAKKYISDKLKKHFK